MNLAIETLADVTDEIGPLLEAHNEAAMVDDAERLDPDWGMYEHLEQQRALMIITMREAGALVGYCVFVLYFSPKSRNLLMADNDLLFIRPEHRGNHAVQKEVRFAEFELQRAGAAKVLWHIKKSHDWSRVILGMGYRDEEVVCTKVI